MQEPSDVGRGTRWRVSRPALGVYITVNVFCISRFVCDMPAAPMSSKIMTCIYGLPRFAWNMPVDPVLSHQLSYVNWVVDFALVYQMGQVGAAGLVRAWCVLIRSYGLPRFACDTLAIPMLWCQVNEALWPGFVSSDESGWCLEPVLMSIHGLLRFVWGLPAAPVLYHRLSYVNGIFSVALVHQMRQVGASGLV